MCEWWFDRVFNRFRSAHPNPTRYPRHIFPLRRTCACIRRLTVSSGWVTVRATAPAMPPHSACRHQRATSSAHVHVQTWVGTCMCTSEVPSTDQPAPDKLKTADDAHAPIHVFSSRPLPFSSPPSSASRRLRVFSPCASSCSKTEKERPMRGMIMSAVGVRPYS